MSEIKPALTAEEWASREYRSGESTDVRFFEYEGRELMCIDAGCDYDDYTAVLEPEHRHAVAALALYGQPFGFTREDAELLRDLEDAPDDQRLAVSAVRAKIEALLPPEAK